MSKMILTWVKKNCRFVKADGSNPDNQLMISGEGVALLYNTIVDMIGRGAPVERNDYGFNGQDFPYFKNNSHLLSPSEMPLPFVVQAVRALMKYKARQVPHWEELKQKVQVDIDNARAKSGQKRQDTSVGEKKVNNLGNGSYGKVKLFIPSLERKIELSLKRAVREEMSKDPVKYPPSQNKYSGKNEPPVYRGISQDRQNFDQWEIHPTFIPIISSILKAAGYDVSEMEPSPASIGTANPAAGSAVPSSRTKTVKATQSGDGITIKFDYDPLMVDTVKKLFPKRRYDSATKAWTLFDADKASLQSLSDSFEQQGFDASELQNISSKSSEKPKTTVGATMEVIDISDMSRFQIGIKSSRDKELNKKMKDALRYIFPAYGDDAMRVYNKDSYRWEVKGKKSQYYQLYKVLKINGFDVTNLVNVVKSLLSQKKIDDDRVQGRLEGYEKSYGVNDIPKFDADLDGMIKKPLYEKQKDGVRFLYGNTSAILGDETGAGKTPMLISSALMRMKQDGGRTLIITLPSTQRQWIKEIEKWSGEKDISTDPNSTSRWVVLYYNMFAAHQEAKPSIQAQGTPQNIQIPKPIKKRDKLVQDILSKKDFTCLILDECHNVKNENITSKNIAEIAKSIPFKWGASATFIANKAIDAYNQLNILGHPLGELPKGRFKREFGGMVPEGWGGAYIDGPPVAQYAAAANLRKWMTQMGAYIKRTKKDINPDMPNHTVENLPVDIDMSRFDGKVKARMQNYKDKDLAVSKMIAQRVEAAEAKVPFTLDMAKNILMQDKKVLIFTCFVEPAQKLSDGLKKIINSSDIGGGNVEVVVGNIDKDQVAEAVARFKDPRGNSKAMVLSILKGGTGIDLPNVVEDVLINDFSWTPKDAEQSEGRAFRISSTADVTTTYVVAQNSPDIRMFDYVQQKKDIAAKIQNLEKKEMEYVLKGMKTDDLQKERARLLDESKRLDIESQINQM